MHSVRHGAEYNIVNTISPRNYYPDFKNEKPKCQNSKYLSEISQQAGVRFKLLGYGPINAIPSLSLTFSFVAVLISNL